MRITATYYLTTDGSTLCALALPVNSSLRGHKGLLLEEDKVDPFEVEDVIQHHPHVQEVVVVGTKRPYIGKVIKAVVVAIAGCSEKELITAKINWQISKFPEQLNLETKYRRVY